MRAVLGLVLLLVLPACGGSDTTASGGWLTFDGNTPPVGSSDGAGGADGGGDGEPELEAFWYGESQVQPGTSYAGEHGFIVLQFRGEEETVLCEATWSATSTAVRTDCTDCDFAFDLSLGEATVNEEVNGGCAANGFVANNPEPGGTTLAVRQGQVLRYDGMAWSPTEESTAGAEEGAYHWTVYTAVEEEEED